MFSRYYQSELTYLRQLGKEFAEENPALAGMFSERGGDPDVERLLEGFAFLTARIRERIENAVPEVIDAVGQLVIPQAMRPIPATSVLQFEPNLSALRKPIVIAAGTEVLSNPVDGTTCSFRTTGPVRVAPLTLGDARLDDSSSQATTIRVGVRNKTSMPLRHLEGLRLFLNGPGPLTSSVFLWMTRHLTRVHVEAGGTKLELAPRVLPSGCGGDMPLLPWPDAAPEGLRAIQEFFVLPEKFGFLDVLGFDQLDESIDTPDFQLVFTFARPPRLPERLPEDVFQLHCVPVANLFETDGEPISQRVGEEEYLIRASGIHPHHAEVYSVDGVVGMSAKTGKRRDYNDFYQFEHLGRSRAEQRFFVVRRSGSPIDNRIDSYLSVMSPADVDTNLDDEVLSSRLTCTNRALTSELRVGDICKRAPGSPSVVKFKNIVRVSRPTRMAVGRELHWRVTSHLALNAQSLCSAVALRAFLREYNVHEEADLQLFRTNEKHIDAIRKVEAHPERRVIDRLPMRGLHVQIELDEDGFAAPGQACVFGHALESLFVTETPLNSFHRMTMTLQPSGTVMEWKPRLGTQALF